MPRLSDTTIVHKVLVQPGLLQLAIVVLIDELVDGNSMLFRIRLQDMREVTGLGLWRNTLAARSVPRQPGFRVKRWFPHPVRVIFLDRSSDGTLQPLHVLFLHLSRHLVEDL
jgi:hypothetical protein